jgi:hypothetical protein
MDVCMYVCMYVYQYNITVAIINYGVWRLTAERTNPNPRNKSHTAHTLCTVTADFLVDLRVVVKRCNTTLTYSKPFQLQGLGLGRFSLQWQTMAT